MIKQRNEMLRIAVRKAKTTQIALIPQKSFNWVGTACVIVKVGKHKWEPKATSGNMLAGNPQANNKHTPILKRKHRRYCRKATNVRWRVQNAVLRRLLLDGEIMDGKLQRLTGSKTQPAESSESKATICCSNMTYLSVNMLSVYMLDQIRTFI